MDVFVVGLRIVREIDWGKLGLWKDMKVIYLILLTASILFQIHIVGGG